jgi:hypothetical protein
MYRLLIDSQSSALVELWRFDAVIVRFLKADKKGAAQQLSKNEIAHAHFAPPPPRQMYTIL